MIAICTRNQLDSSPLVFPNDLNLPISNNNFVSSTVGYTIDSNLLGYCITEGKEYTVYSLLVYNNQLSFLIADDNGIPGFFPSDLFSVEMPQFSWDWALKTYKIEKYILIAIGPIDFIYKYENIRDMIAGTKSAISWFLAYKKFTEYYDCCDFS